MNKKVTTSPRHQLTPKKILLILISVLWFLVSFSFAQDEIVYEDKGRRDPFIALVTADGRLLNLELSDSQAKIVVQGIIYDEKGDSYAIINAEVVGVGDYVLGQAVYKIEKNKVILLKDNKPVEYILEKEEP